VPVATTPTAPHSFQAPSLRVQLGEGLASCRQRNHPGVGALGHWVLSQENAGNILAGVGVDHDETHLAGRPLTEPLGNPDYRPR
jgi:hypothetical protein